MLLSNFENKDSLMALFGGKEPSLDDISIREVSLVTGEDISVIVKFDTKELPAEMPLKWKIAKVNTMQITLEMINVLQYDIAVGSSNFEHLSISAAMSSSGAKSILFNRLDGPYVVRIFADFIYIKNFSAYTET